MLGPAHILGSGGGPGPIVWLPLGVVVAGMLAWLLGGRLIRRLGAMAAGAGIVATLVLSILAPGSPSRPRYVLELRMPQPDAQVTSPIVVLVCGHLPDGSPAPVPGPDRVLSVSLDGSQLETGGGSSVVVPASPGPHDLRIDVLTSEHRAYDPPIDLDVRVAVTGAGTLSTIPSCPG